jgi:hypothetical protein
MKTTPLPTLLVLCSLAAAATIWPGHSQAQHVPQVCSWDQCALRVKAPTLTTPAVLVRGIDDIEVARLGLLEPAIAPFVQLSDSAVARAEVYDVLYDRGSIISITGTVVAITAPILFRGTMQKIVWTGVGVGVSFYGGLVVNRANEALSEAVWWYNRELHRGQIPGFQTEQLPEPRREPF